MSNGPSNRKISKNPKVSSKELWNIENEAIQISTSKSITKPSPNEMATISRDDILPQINEDEEEINVVMINNKKVKLKSPPRKPYQINMRTEPSKDP